MAKDNEIKRLKEKLTCDEEARTKEVLRIKKQLKTEQTYKNHFRRQYYTIEKQAVNKLLNSEGEKRRIQLRGEKLTNFQMKYV